LKITFFVCLIPDFCCKMFLVHLQSIKNIKKRELNQQQQNKHEQRKTKAN